MQVNNIKPFLLFLAILATSCIKSYEPLISSGDVFKVVVSGVVSDRDGNQTVSISLTSRINSPEPKPMPGCTVTIADIQGHRFPMTDLNDGNYHGFISPSYLVKGNAFLVEVTTPDGDEIISDNDPYTTGPEVDSVFYTLKEIPTGNPNKSTKGIQFYVNLDAGATDSRFYRWEAFETFEYHSDYLREWYYDGRLHHISPPDSSLRVCWLTLMVRDVFALSTQNLAENKYTLFPLHFVNNKTARLVYGYSLLVNQYSLSEQAYNYWDQLRTNSTNEGGLYEKQPLSTKGNLRNLTHPDQDVLGYFGVSSLHSKRIFVSNVENLELEYISPCTMNPLGQWGLADVNPKLFPIYLLGDFKGWQPIIMAKSCVDCTSLFGINVKPEFWPY
ncbi:MAG: DUF4249 family protein [Bacteroidetes bacterium]|nr:DUF4249 family protein [Bacteroidota bacterium]